MRRNSIIVAVWGAAVALATAVSALAGDAPADPRPSMRGLLNTAGAEAAASLDREQSAPAKGLRMAGKDGPPWAVDTVCDMPRNQYWDAFGRRMSRKVRAPTEGDERATATINNRLPRDLTRLSESLPAKGKAVFLKAGERLDRPASDWPAALRQRAEWTLVLNGVASELAARAGDETDFGANYTAGVWTRFYCDFIDSHAGFLRRYVDAVGKPEDKADRELFDLLAAMSGHASEGD